jgi:hypothetical protein
LKQRTLHRNVGLTRWFKEDWQNQTGSTGYNKRGDIYRPTKRISSKTPKLLQSLSQNEINKFMKEKLAKGRVNKF